MDEIIKVTNLRQAYGRIPVLDGVSFSLAPGRITGLLGPNGCGKTTLMKVLTGLIKSYSGEAVVCGEKPGTPASLARVAYLPDSPSLYTWMKAGMLLDMQADFFSDFDRVKAAELCKRLGLHEQMRLKTMSKGMQEKLQLILVICRRANLYLFDEPLGAVDVSTREQILSLLLQDYSEDASVLLSTHLIADVEKIFDSVLFLGGGRIVVDQSVDTLREQYGKSVEEAFREVFVCSPNL